MCGIRRESGTSKGERMSLTGTLRERHPRVTAGGAEAPRGEKGGEPTQLVGSHSPAFGRPSLPHLEAAVTGAGLPGAGGWSEHEDQATAASEAPEGTPRSRGERRVFPAGFQDVGGDIV